jgi:hypothetical protein
MIYILQVSDPAPPTTSRHYGPTVADALPAAFPRFSPPASPQALQDSRQAAGQFNPVLYAQCLVAAASVHMAALLRHGRPLDLTHLRCGPDCEVSLLRP